jgi:glycosyltransferase involved in cell wall biosynthesis
LSAPAVDVVMPAYNAGQFIRVAIDSVLAQTHTNLQLYVVDDGSTDATPEIVASMDDERVNYVFRQHGGPSAARNTGIAASDAPYIAFLDADDRWCPQKLTAQVGMLEREPSVALVHGFQRTIDATGAAMVERGGGLRGYVFDSLLGGNLVTGSASVALVRRRALDRVGGFREDLLVAEDWELWLRIARAYAFDHVPEILVEVRVHKDGLQQNVLGMARGRIKMFEETAVSMSLGRRERATLARACLLPSVSDFALAGQPVTALRTLLRLIRLDPGSVSALRAARFYLWIVVMAVKQLRHGRVP